MADKKKINVGMIGTGFMGKAHSFGFRNVNQMWDPPVRAVMKCITGSRSEETCRAAAADYGWEGYEADWRAMIARDDIDLVDVSSPNFQHREQVEAAAAAGKDILCEKPLANNLEDAAAMTAAVEKAGVRGMCGFTYRQAPAVQLAREMVASGELGVIRHFRAVYLQDWIMDPEFPLVWRLQKEWCGSGTLGDIGAHITDMALFLVGDIAEVCGTTETFIKERSLVSGAGSTQLKDQKAAAEKGPVTVDDAVTWCARFADGALGTFEASRFAGGHKNGHAWEINGSKGSIRWNLEDMNYLEYWKDGEGRLQGFRKILATEPDTPNWESAWWPGGHIIGYGECFVNQMKEFLTAIAEGRQPAPSMRDGLRCQAVLDAIEKSAESRLWTEVPHV